MKKLTKRKKVYICYRGNFWTGHSWTSIRQFAKKYKTYDALTIILKRFNNKYPRPRMRLVSYFEKKAARARAKALREKAKMRESEARLQM